MPENASSSWVSELSWPDVEQRISQGASALLPVGASAKEHGRHLPMNTDFIQAKWLSHQLALQNDLLIWPVVNYGYYPAFVEFPGSVSLSEATFSSMITDIVDSIFRAGIDRIALLNTGISTIKPLDDVIAHSSGDICLINVYSGQQFKQTVIQVIEQTQGGHADETETSIMLAINETLVNMRLASGSMTACEQPGRLSRGDPQSLNYTPSGACGAPQLGTPDKGLLLLKAMLKDANRRLSVFCDPAN